MFLFFGFQIPDFRYGHDILRGGYPDRRFLFGKLQKSLFANPEAAAPRKSITSAVAMDQFSMHPKANEAKIKNIDKIHKEKLYTIITIHIIIVVPTVGSAMFNSILYTIFPLLFNGLALF